MSELKSFYNDVSKNDEDRETTTLSRTAKGTNFLKSSKFNGVSLFATDSRSKELIYDFRRWSGINRAFPSWSIRKLRQSMEQMENLIRAPRGISSLVGNYG